MSRDELARRKALWAERKANEASASNEPWAMGNLRLYQNLASRYWAECYAAERDENGGLPQIATEGQGQA